MSVSKGNAVRPWVESGRYDLLMALGDDTTDETMFAVMPEDAWTLRVGAGQTRARRRLAGPGAVRRLLRYLVAESEVARLER